MTQEEVEESIEKSSVTETLEINCLVLLGLVQLAVLIYLYEVPTLDGGRQR